MVAIRIEEVQPSEVGNPGCKRCGWHDRMSAEYGLCALCFDIGGGFVFGTDGMMSEEVTEARKRLQYHRECLAVAQTQRGRIYHLTAIALEESIIDGHEETLEQAAEADGQPRAWDEDEEYDSFAEWCDMVDAHAFESGRDLATAAAGR